MKVMLNGSRSHSTTMSYPKWLMQQHLKRDLSPNEHVDHIDGDIDNNDLSNLQLLSPEDNSRKWWQQSGALDRAYIELVCQTCGCAFKRTRSQEEGRIAKNRSGPFCGKTCVGKAHPMKKGTVTSRKRKNKA